MAVWLACFLFAALVHVSRSAEAWKTVAVIFVVSGKDVSVRWSSLKTTLQVLSATRLLHEWMLTMRSSQGQHQAANHALINLRIPLHGVLQCHWSLA